MTLQTKLKLAMTRKGRIILHFLCFLRDYKFLWHLKGVLRELRHV